MKSDQSKAALECSMRFGRLFRMGDMQKITALLPRGLLATAQQFTGAGVTDTLKIALEALAHDHFYDRLNALEGKLALELDLHMLREDRDDGERDLAIH